MTSLGIGLIGCGNISDAYLKGASHFPVLNILACADINMEAASAKASQYGLKAQTVEALLEDPSIDVILNLTTPQHHVNIDVSALKAGKHCYSEKPLGISLAEAKQLVDLTTKTGLRLGCAPDTFLGGAHQTARHIMDGGDIGDPVAGSAFMMVPGHERWHPNPDFYYQAGGGPLMDMGPYYLTDLINLFGPVASVSGSAKATYQSRTVGSGKRKGQRFDVDVPTHISSLLNFHNGATVTLVTSFDIHKHDHSPIEIYGTKGSMIVADPNNFDGDIKISDAAGDWTTAQQIHSYGDANYRGIGLADMVEAIMKNQDHRASLNLSLHVLEIMESIIVAAETGQRIDLQHLCERPAPLIHSLPAGQLHT